MNEVKIIANVVSSAKVVLDTTELIKNVEELESRYANLVITDEDIKLAMEIRADLNASEKKITDRKKEIKAEAIGEFTKSEKEIAAIAKRVKTLAETIGESIKSYDVRMVDEKKIRCYDQVKDYKDYTNYFQWQSQFDLKGTSEKEIIQHFLEQKELLVSHLANIDVQANKFGLTNDYKPMLLTMEFYEVVIRMNEDYQLLQTKPEPTPEPVEVVMPLNIIEPINVRTTTFQVTGTDEQLSLIADCMDKLGVKYKKVGS